MMYSTTMNTKKGSGQLWSTQELPSGEVDTYEPVISPGILRETHVIPKTPTYPLGTVIATAFAC